jgi:uncharacterized membrane protein
MKVVTVWAFPEQDAAKRAESILGTLSAQGAVSVCDGAILSWPRSRGKPQPRALQSVALTETVGVGFWGMFIGVVFFAPALAALSRIDEVSLSRALVGIGLDENFIRSVRGAVVPGTSALLLLTSTPPEPAAAAFSPLNPRRLEVVLSDCEQRVLRKVFAG